jgi:mono/diheme cytochrome c family protein
MTRSVRLRRLPAALLAAAALTALAGAAAADQLRADTPAVPGHAIASGRVPLDSLAASPEEYEGWKYFHVYCFRCHGVDAIGADLAPDLRRSVSEQGSVTRDVFITTVTNGRLEKGMPSWKQLLTADQITSLYAYVKARSERRLAAGRPHRKAAE